MKKKSIVLWVIVICAVLASPIVIEKFITNYSSSIPKDEYSYQTFQIDQDKWGYVILHFDKKFIKQNYIPGINGKNCFKNEEDAGNTAKLVISKLKRKETPSLTEEELKKLGVVL
jgi:hypothetical protein